MKMLKALAELVGLLTLVSIVYGAPKIVSKPLKNDLEDVSVIVNAVRNLGYKHFEGDIVLVERVGQGHIKYVYPDDESKVVFQRKSSKTGEDVVVLSSTEDGWESPGKKRRFVVLKLKPTSGLPNHYYPILAFVRDANPKDVDVVEFDGVKSYIEFIGWKPQNPKEEFFGAHNCGDSFFLPCTPKDSGTQLATEQWLPESSDLTDVNADESKRFKLNGVFSVKDNYEFYGDLEIRRKRRGRSLIPHDEDEDDKHPHGWSQPNRRMLGTGSGSSWTGEPVAPWEQQHTSASRYSNHNSQLGEIGSKKQWPDRWSNGLYQGSDQSQGIFESDSRKSIEDRYAKLRDKANDIDQRQYAGLPRGSGDANSKSSSLSRGKGNAYSSSDALNKGYGVANSQSDAFTSGAGDANSLSEAMSQQFGISNSQSGAQTVGAGAANSQSQALSEGQGLSNSLSGASSYGEGDSGSKSTAYSRDSGKSNSKSDAVATDYGGAMSQSGAYSKQHGQSNSQSDAVSGGRGGANSQSTALSARRGQSNSQSEAATFGEGQANSQSDAWSEYSGIANSQSGALATFSGNSNSLSNALSRGEGSSNSRSHALSDSTGGANSMSGSQTLGAGNSNSQSDAFTGGSGNANSQSDSLSDIEGGDSNSQSSSITGSKFQRNSEDQSFWKWRESRDDSGHAGKVPNTSKFYNQESLAAGAGESNHNLQRRPLEIEEEVTGSALWKLPDSSSRINTGRDLFLSSEKLEQIEDKAWEKLPDSSKTRDYLSPAEMIKQIDDTAWDPSWRLNDDSKHGDASSSRLIENVERNVWKNRPEISGRSKTDDDYLLNRATGSGTRLKPQVVDGGIWNPNPPEDNEFWDTYAPTDGGNVIIRDGGYTPNNSPRRGGNGNMRGGGYKPNNVPRTGGSLERWKGASSERKKEIDEHRSSRRQGSSGDQGSADSGGKGKGDAVANAKGDTGKVAANAVSKSGGAIANAINGTVAAATALSMQSGDAKSNAETYGEGGAKSNSMAMGAGRATSNSISRGTGEATSNSLAAGGGDAASSSFSAGGGNALSNSVAKKGGNAASNSVALKGGDSKSASSAFDGGNAKSNSMSSGGGSAQSISNAQGGGDAQSNSLADSGGSAHSISNAAGGGDSLSNAMAKGGGNAQSDAIATGGGDATANAMSLGDDGIAMSPDEIESMVAQAMGGAFQFRRKKRSLINRPATWSSRKKRTVDVGPFFYVPGWTVRTENPTANITFKHEDVPFYGFGGCDFEPYSPQDVILGLPSVYLKALKVQCIGSKRTIFSELLSKDILEETSKGRFTLKPNNPLVVTKKLSTKEHQNLCYAFEMSILSSFLPMAEAGGGATSLLSKDVPINRSVRTFAEYILYSLDEMRIKYRTHIILLTRHLISVSKMAYARLLHDYDNLVFCTECESDQKVNRNDRIELMALLEFMLKGLSPYEEGATPIHKNFLQFFFNNKEAIEQRVKCLVV